MTIQYNVTPPPCCNPARQKYRDVWLEMERLAVEAIEAEDGTSSWSATTLPDYDTAQRCRAACLRRWKKAGASTRIEFRLIPGESTLYFRAMTRSAQEDAA